MKSVPNIVLGVITGLVVLLAIVAAIFSSRDTTTDWPDDSPEAVVQSYAQAVIDQDFERAITLMDPELECTPEHFEQSYYPQDTAISLIQAHIGPDEATVTAELGSYGDPFFDPFIGQEHFELIPADTGWLITGTPWPVYGCAGML